MLFNTLTQWLDWIKNAHFKDIDFNLSRIRQVLEKLQIKQPTCPVITIAGTNGKGSCVAGLESIYLAAGYKVGAYSSPYLFRYNEQIRLQASEVTDERLCNAFNQIANHLNGITLTPFEFSTLAAFLIFHEACLDVWILEVGMGGRLDAVNTMDADIAIISTIAIDHVEWLGSTREAIAFEKAGIFRPFKPVVCGDSDPPSTLGKQAIAHDSPFFCQKEHFYFEQQNNNHTWNWRYGEKWITELPLPTLALQNMSTVLMAVELMQYRLPVSASQIKNGLRNITLPGRIQIFPGEVTTIFDVSHNPASVAMFAEYLQQKPIKGKTHAVFSMLADKDIIQSIKIMKAFVDKWYIAPLSTERSISREALVQFFRHADIHSVYDYPHIEEAYKHAKKEAIDNDRIIVFGSFYTVSRIFKYVKEEIILPA